MPRPPHICTCGKTIPHGTRCECQITATRERKARHDARRPSARERGYTKEWEHARAEFLACHPSCSFCNAPATVVDHKTPHRGNQRLFWDRANWQTLCLPCHNRVKQRQEHSL
jgi:5-methylcytosine-specific restriction protein A